MATPPFAGPFEASLKLSVQGGILELLSGHVVYPQFFCCTTCTNVGVPKAPVALIKPSDTVVCANAAMCVDISGSWSPTSTISTWAVDWDDGNVTNGFVWPPGVDICHPLGGYVLPGTYEITLTVTDLLGVTGSDIVEIEVVVCLCNPLGPIGVVVCSDGAGPFYTVALAGGATVWNALNAGLLAAVAGCLTGHVMKEYHWLDGHISLFMGTDAGIYEYVVPSVGSVWGGVWTQVVSAADLLAEVGSFGTTNVWDIVMAADNSGYEGWGYCSFGGNNCGACVAHTRDGWQTLNTGAQAFGGAGAGLSKTMVAIAEHTPTIVYTTAIEIANPARLLRSLASGAPASWGTIDTVAATDASAVYIPWGSMSHDDSTIYWGADGAIRRSVDTGVSFVTIGDFGRPFHMYGRTYQDWKFWLVNWDDDGEARYWNGLNNIQFGPDMCVGCNAKGHRIIM